MMRLLLRALLPSIVVVGLLVAIAAPFVIIYSGAYDVAATRQHTSPVYWALITSLRQSIQAHAAREAPDPPDLRDAGLVDAGLVLYERHCRVCHGAPGIAPDPIGLGLTPPAANLVIPGRDWTPGELHWTIAKGLKMTGMPAWEYHLSDGEIWAIVALVKAMPAFAPAEYASRRSRVLRAGVPEEPR